MKVLYITDPGIVGGATRSLIDVVTAMKSKGVEIVVCTSEYNELNEELSSLGVKSFAARHRAMMEVSAPSVKYYIKQYLKYQWYNKRAVSAIEKQINIKEFDLIHTNSARNDFGMILSKRNGVKHICHLREFGQEDFNCWSYRRNYIKFYNENADVFIAISNAVKNSWVRKGLRKEKVIVIYNGVNDTSIEASDINRYLDCQPLRMVIVGGVCHPKGQGQLIEAINLLPENVKNNILLDIIGWGSEQYISELKSQIKEYNLESQIKFLGARKDIGCILKNYHVGMMCSRSEGFGRVTAEYMHAGLGVIASDTGANTEIIENNSCGMIYHLDDCKELAKCIERYYTDREFLSEMAIAGREKAKKFYTKELNAENIYKLYESVING